MDEALIERAFDELTRQGHPAVRGEVIEGDVAGYHYHPGRARVPDWLTAEGLAIEQEMYKQEDGWGCRHMLLPDGTSS